MVISQEQHDRHFMTLALNEARKALAANEIPIGCVIVLSGQIISSAGNSRYGSRSKIAHAELNSLLAGADLLHDHKGECDLFVTLEPCMMCMGAIVSSRIRRVVYGAKDHMAGAVSLLTFKQHYTEFAPQVVGGVLAEESLAILRAYVERTGGTWGKQYFGLDLVKQQT